MTSPNGLKAGKWDITEPGWVPDWFGPTNGRATLPDILDGALSFPGTDWGGYDDPAVDALVNQAESATTISQRPQRCGTRPTSRSWRTRRSSPSRPS